MRKIEIFDASAIFVLIGVFIFTVYTVFTRVGIFSIGLKNNPTFPALHE